MKPHAFARSLLVATSLLAAPTMAQWSPDASSNTPVAVKPGDQTVVKLAVASDGSSWTGWFDFAPSGVELRVQRLDARGVPSFGPEGLLVSDNTQGTSTVDWDLRTDNAGNAVIAFVDIRNGGDNDVYAYLVAPDGSMLWGENGVTVSDNAQFEADPRITQLSGGDYAVVWPRFDVLPGLIMQRISPAGVKAFAGDGVVIASNGNEEPAFLEMVPTSDNGLIVAYIRSIASFLSPRHVYAQKVDAAGAPQWGASPVIVQDAASVPIAHKPRILNDGADGAIIAWHDTRDGDFDSYVQRLSPAGVPLFAANGVPASSEFGRQQLDPSIAIAPSGDIMMFYRNLDGAQSQQGMNLQRFDAITGDRAFGGNGINLVPFNAQFKGPPRAVAHQDGAAAVYDRQPALGSSNGTLEMLIADESGDLLGGAPIPVSTADSSKGRLNLDRTPDGTTVAAWSDTRNGGEDIYAQRINADGTLGGPKTCPADIAAPFGTTNFFDLLAYIASYNAGDPAADLAAPIGTINFFDLLEYINTFNTCVP